MLAHDLPIPGPHPATFYDAKKSFYLNMMPAERRLVHNHPISIPFPSTHLLNCIWASVLRLLLAPIAADRVKR